MKISTILDRIDDGDVALLIDEDAEVGQIAVHAGYLYFTDPNSFKR